MTLTLYTSFNSDTLELHIFQDEPGKYTNGQVIGDVGYFIPDPTNQYCWSSIGNKSVNGVQINGSCRSITTDGQPLVLPHGYAMCNISTLESIDLTGIQITGAATFMFANTRNLQSLTVSDDWLDPDEMHHCGEMFVSTSLPQSEMQDALDKCYQIHVSSGTGMFRYNEHLTQLDLRMVVMSSATNYITEMFKGDIALRKIIVDPNYGWETFVSRPNDARDAFTDCNNLVGGAGTGYDSTRTNGQYCRIDNPPDNPGYLTAI